MSEFNVFLAAMRWVEADESREHFLDEVLGLVRFPTMDYEELGLVGKHPVAAGAAILKVCCGYTTKIHIQHQHWVAAFEIWCGRNRQRRNAIHVLLLIAPNSCC